MRSPSRTRSSEPRNPNELQNINELRNINEPQDIDEAPEHRLRLGAADVAGLLTTTGKGRTMSDVLAMLNGTHREIDYRDTAASRVRSLLIRHE
jgi:hypothetical protein